MTSTAAELVARRERAMERADRALDTAWPERKGEHYIREMQSAANELELVAQEMRTDNVEAIESSRAYRYLGSVYSDLAPALGKDMLAKATQAYREAEDLLPNHADALEHAKLDFNLANALRQLDANDIEQLREAERRFLSARGVFAELAPQHLPSIDEALTSTRNLLKIAPLAKSVERNLADMEQLESDLVAGEDGADIAGKLQEARERDGGIWGLLTAVQGLVNELPPSAKQDAKFGNVTEEIAKLTSLVRRGEGPTDPMSRKIMNMLRDKLEEEAHAGRVAPDRAETLANLLDDFGRTLESGSDDIQALMGRVEDIRTKAAGQFENLHYMSHGIDRPPEGSRAAKLVELCWCLRLFLLDEMNQRGKSDGESRLVSDLNIRASRVDKRIYQVGDDDARAKIIEQDALRPLAIEIRSFAARHHPMLARPVWAGAKMQVAPNSVLFSGSTNVREQVSEICIDLGFELMSEPKGESIAASHWQQLQTANIAVFDLSVPAGPARAAVAYELGIARTLGKPVVVIGRQDQKIPFDVDVQPVHLSDSAQDTTAISEAIDQASVWVMPRPRSSAVVQTIDEVLRRYSIRQDNTFVDQTLKHLQSLQADLDPVAVTDTLNTLLSFLKDDGLTLLHPIWPPAYPETGKARLFHVMPFRPEWADAAARHVAEACTSRGATYVRGDRVSEPNVIRSIWKEISQATHILADLTGFNENVALELGIAHTLGRPSLIIGQGDTIEQLFPMIAKLRFYPYNAVTSAELGSLVKEFLD